MSEIPTNCPYCNAYIKVEIEGIVEGEESFDYCHICKKKFIFYVSYSVDIYPEVIKEAQNGS